MKLDRILVAVNSLNSRDAAFERALALARSSGAELYVLHAVPANQRFSFGGARRLQRMAALRKRAEDEGVRVQTVEQHGDPAEIIDLHASARAADLIVMGGEPRRSWRRGSLVAERVIRRTNVPTLVVAGDAAEVPTPFRTVLVAVDLSPASKEVLDGAIALTRGAAVQLTMMHAVDGEETSQARRMLREVASNVPANVDTRVRVSAGSAARAIHERAGTLNADLVVVGRSRGFKILGSTALRVLRKNDRALLVVPSGARRSQQLERDLAA